MKLKFFILPIMLMLLGMVSCTKYWDDHFDAYPETVNQNVWDAMQNDPEISEFVEILKELEFDTLFSSNKNYTLFIPTNSAIVEYTNENPIDTFIVKYHISTHFIQSGSIQDRQKIQTFSGKFAFFERTASSLKFDDISLKSESPLYLNGKYFVMDEVARPLENFYQFFSFNNPVLKDYIDSQDSIVIDKEESKPIGYDDNGNTVYDTVSYILNKFEELYFPVKHEFRNKTATFVFPLQDDYRSALNQMAENMSIPGIVDYKDIPLDWQNDVLIPHLLEQGIFSNMLEPEEFSWESAIDTLKLKNILGDSIKILYTPTNKKLLSNGYAYDYSNYRIPDSLYLGGSRFEVERLLRLTGVNRYAWEPLVASVISDGAFKPYRDYIADASNDSIVRVIFNKGYSGKYSLEFETQKLFPRRYVMVVRTHMDIGGIYEVYVNDELVKTFDYYQFLINRGLSFSVTGERYLPEGRFNKFDMYVDNIQEYERAKVRFEYTAPGNVSSNGLVIDYVEFIPASN